MDQKPKKENRVEKEMMEHEIGKGGKGGEVGSVGEGRAKEGVLRHIPSASHGTTAEQSSRMCVTFSSPASAVDPVDLAILAEKVATAFPPSSQSRSLRFRNAFTLAQRVPENAYI